MKRIKKLLCILLAALLLVTTGAFAVSAEEPVQPDMEALHQKFTKYLDDLSIYHYYPGDPDNPDDPAYEMSHIEFIVNSNGWNIFLGDSGMSDPMPVSEQLDNYIFFSDNWKIPYQVGIYAEKNDAILTLKDAYNKNQINLGDIAQECYELEEVGRSPRVRLIGDTNKDNKISMADVLDIQKIVAQINSQLEEYAIPDYNQDGTINLKDALDMQKFIAKITA